MNARRDILTDRFGRKHTYLRISLLDRCNLRCTYCMPAEGVPLRPRAQLMTFDEIYAMAQTLTDFGISKIRLTGGEPLARKDAPQLMERLATLPASLTLTTNAVLADAFIPIFRRCGIQGINVSLDSLCRERFQRITRRDLFDQTYRNIQRLIEEGFSIKINVALLRGVNDGEIIDFIQLTKSWPVVIRFIELMPFRGNGWKADQLVSFAQIMDRVGAAFDPQSILRLQDAPHDTSENFQIAGYRGSFAIISSITRPFCSSCNRLRLTADGKLKNCLFSSSEVDLLTPLRAGKDIYQAIEAAVQSKQAVRGGMATEEQIRNKRRHSRNRSMVSIGG